mgnify:CR=1 FL=1
MESSNKGKSLYYQLVDLLKDRIETQMTPHDKLLSERELCQHYGVSRTTVRLALQELENQGYIYRRHGKGTYVSDLSDKSSNLAGAYSFTEEMREIGRVPKTVILEFRQMEANKRIAKNLNIHLGETVFKLKRLRLADEEPLMVERSYLPAKLFMGLDLPLLESKPLYDVFSQDYEQKKDAAVLRIADGAPVLHLTRITYNVKNEIIEYTDSVARADQFHYKIRHIRK